MLCDLNFSAQNDERNAKSLLDFIWHVKFLPLPGAIFYDLSLCLCRDIDTMKWNDMVLETHVEPAFQPLRRGSFLKYSERSRNILLVKICQPTRLLKTRMLIVDKIQLYYCTHLLPTFSKISYDISSKRNRM